MIIEKIYEDDDGNKTLATLARTAHLFEDAALDKLWSTQQTIVPLVRCFPSETLEETCDEYGDSVLVSPMLSSLCKLV